ncbi:peptidase S8/S53 domain-containing protein [Scheffersomyces coipomensis]|uniref:peptidase S8/S53 domain-containing protein n=1 Tax=Scheffersomyces coipomensis TaxID=1788519 RepID=UPI00315DEF15
MLPINILILILGCLQQIVATGYNIPTRDYDEKNYFLLELNTTSSQKPLIDFINQHSQNYNYEHQLYGFDNHYVFSIDKSHSHNQFLGNLNKISNDESEDESKLMKRSDGFEDHYDGFINNEHLKSIYMLPPKKLSKRLPVPFTPEEVEYQQAQNNQHKRLDIVDSSQEPVKKASDKLGINDPGFIEQWHLINTLSPGHDVNVTELWYEGITGKGIVTAIIDDGLDAESEDLKANFNKKGSWDFNDNTNIPLPRLFDDYHGTRCAGEIAAVKNDVCGIGVAYDSQVSGIRILSGPITATEEASAMIYGLDVNDIYSCSWGPTDDGRTLSAPEPIVKKAMIKGIQQGRASKGSVYVFASGNGGRYGDSCNFDGYTNSIYSITVGAIDFKGLHPSYAEACSAVMVVTYSSGSGEHIHTTDIKQKCTAQHGGTSAAAPLAAGVYSLILSANPNLTWRDVQYISVLSSDPINEDDGHYQTTALGRKYSHKYGYGRMDAYSMAHFAQTWTNVKPQAWFYSDVQDVKKTINLGPDVAEKNQIIKQTITVTPQDLKIINLERVEHVTVTVNIQANFRGRVGVRLISPTGVISDLATFRPSDSTGIGFKNWTFMSVAHWGESGVGDWVVEVFGDESKPGNIQITFDNWQLRFFGESIDANEVETYDLDKDYAAIRRDKQAEADKEEPVDEATSIGEPSSSTTEANSSEIASEVITSSNDSVSSAPSEEDSVSEPPVIPTDEPNEDEINPEEPEDGKNKQYTGNHTGQYFMAVAVIGFIIVLVVMRFNKTPGSGRRRRRRDEYEFDIIPGEDYSDSDALDDDEFFEDDADAVELTFTRPGQGQQDDESTRDDETLPKYQEQDQEMFAIGGEEDDESAAATGEEERDALVEKPKIKKEVSFKTDKHGDDDDEDNEDDRLLSSEGRSSSD